MRQLGIIIDPKVRIILTFHLKKFVELKITIFEP
jgi:hypothetical protein